MLRAKHIMGTQAARVNRRIGRKNDTSPNWRASPATTSSSVSNHEVESALADLRGPLAGILELSRVGGGSARSEAAYEAAGRGASYGTDDAG